MEECQSPHGHPLRLQPFQIRLIYSTSTAEPPRFEVNPQFGEGEQSQGAAERVRRREWKAHEEPFQALHGSFIRYGDHASPFLEALSVILCHDEVALPSTGKNLVKPRIRSSSSLRKDIGYHSPKTSEQKLLGQRIPDP
jgi:hypothetical protein